MNNHSLDELLKNQDKIKDDGFSAAVMMRIPKKSQKKKHRAMIISASLMTGVLLSSILLGSHFKLDYLFKGPFLPVMAVSMVIMLSSFFKVANEEIE